MKVKTNSTRRFNKNNVIVYDVDQWRREIGQLAVALKVIAHESL
jgi:hypothetical protein